MAAALENTNSQIYCFSAQCFGKSRIKLPPFPAKKNHFSKERTLLVHRFVFKKIP